MVRILFIVCALLLSIQAVSQTYWRIRNENGEELLLTISVDKETNRYEAHTRKDALREIAGTLNYMLAKTAGKLFYPEIVHSDGTIQVRGDTTFYSGNFKYLDKQFPLKAWSLENNFLGILTDTRGRNHGLTGTRLTSDRQLDDYATMIIHALDLTEKYYWDPGLSGSHDWKSFRNTLIDYKAKISDDYELGALLFWYSRKCQFAPYEIKRIQPGLRDSNSPVNLAVKTLKSLTAYLDLSGLPEERTGMDLIFSDIQKKNYTTLILDARGRKNMSLASAILLADHLVAKPADWGIYITRKSLDANGTIPVPAAYTRFFRDAGQYKPGTDNIYREPGYYMKPTPAPNAFHGKIYLLTDQRTSKVVEAMAIWMKNDKIATLVGKKSAGQPMITELLAVNDLFRITLPVAQFYDISGRSYFGTGIEPDIPTDENALNVVLELEKSR